MNNCHQVLGLSKISIAVASILLAGCSSGGGSSSTSTGSSTNAGVNSSAWIAPITTGVPQVGQSTEIATSSSGLKTSDLMNVINNGGTLTSQSAAGLIVLGAEDEVVINSNAQIEMTFQADGKYTMKVNDNDYPNASIHEYDLDYVGEYGIFATAEKDDGSGQDKYAAVLAGIRTDNADIPTSGIGTYSANEDSYYANYGSTGSEEVPVPNQYTNYISAQYDESQDGEHYYSLDEAYNGELSTNGNFNITLVADFAQSTMKGSAEGIVSNGCCNDAQVTYNYLPLEITFNESSIVQSAFNGSGTANVDDKNIPIDYAGNFFGPGAAEAGIIFEGTDENSSAVSGIGYLNKQ